MRKVVILLFITTIIACEIKEIEKNETRSNTLVIGDSSNCHVEILESITTGKEYKIIGFPIDIDDDGQEDFVFYHYRKDKWGASFVNLKCANEDSYVNVRNVSDTTFLQFHIDSIDGDYFFIGIVELFNCNRESPYGSSPFDSIYEIKNRDFINPFDLKDTISHQDLWRSDSLQLSSSDFDWYACQDTFIESDIKDTGIVVQTKMILDCHLFPNETVKYIAIKKGERLGWIKISIYYNYETRIHEIGLQK